MALSGYMEFVQALRQPAILIDGNFHIIAINKNASSYFEARPFLTSSENLSDFFQRSESFDSIDAPTELTLASNFGADSRWMITPFVLSNIKYYLLVGTDKALNEKNQDTTLHVIEELTELMPGNFYWKDAKGVYLGCNTSLMKTLGFSEKDHIIGKTDYDLWPKQADELRQNDLYVMQTGRPLEREEMALLADGSTGYFAAVKVPLRSTTGEIIGIIGNSLDITAEKRKFEMELENQKLENAMYEAKAKAATEEATKRALLIFSGMSTHDIRTPLSSISLRAAFLKKHLPALNEAYKAADAAGLEIPHIQTKVLTDLQRTPLDILQALKEANEYIDSSLKSLKSASQGEELVNKDQLTDCNAERLLRRIVDGYPYKDNQATLLHYSPENDFNFKGNVIFFNRLVENLIKNAFEQIELKGRGEIFIHCAQENQFNLIKIKDTAGGVTQETIDKLFGGIKSTKEGGTGIGLSSAKQTMRGMNGDIKAHLVDGDCIEFVLSFPKI